MFTRFCFWVHSPDPLPPRLRAARAAAKENVCTRRVGPVCSHGQRPRRKCAFPGERRDQFVKRVGSLSRRQRLRRLNLITRDLVFNLLLRGVRPTTTTTVIIMIK